MPTIVIGHFLLESLESIGETSFDGVEINPRIDDACNVAAVDNGINEVDALWKTIKSSPGRVNVALPVEASAEKIQRCQRVVRIDGESSQLGSLRILPQTQCLISRSDTARDSGLERVAVMSALQHRQRVHRVTDTA